MANKNLAKVFRSKPALIVLTAVVLVLFILLILWVKSLLPDEPPKQRKRVQEITVVTPPPPPPPPPKIEEPPPEEPEMEEEVPPEEPLDDSPPEDTPPDQPAGEDLGVDAEGGAGGDAFGLVGKKGGRGLLDGGGGGYGVYLKGEINSALTRDDDLKTMGYEAIVKLWMNADGSIQRHSIRLLNGSEKAKQELERFFNNYGRFNKRLPLEENQDWFTFKIRSQL